MTLRVHNNSSRVYNNQFNVIAMFVALLRRNRSVDKVIADVDEDAAKRRFELKAIIKEYELLRLTIKLGPKGRII